MTRYEANLKLLNILSKLIDQNTDQRFSQILLNYGFVSQNDSNWNDDFYIESEALLNRIDDSKE